MKTDLDHLPELKRRDLQRVVRIIFSEFEEVVAIATQSWKKQGRILTVILYGAYARADWAASRGNAHAWDYDILVVVNHEKLANEIEYWGRAKDALTREYSLAERISARPSLVVHSLDDFNRQLSRGCPFFVNILREGVALYQLGTTPFRKPKLLSPDALREETQHQYNQWFSNAGTFLNMAKFAMSCGSNANAAFQLHQAAEQLYQTVLVVRTLHSPLSHNLEFLRSRAEHLARDLIPIWPRDDTYTKRCFELLHQAYIKGRYSPHYSVSDADLRWIFERVELLQASVKSVADRRISNI